ncbi:MAG: hypothetical protein JO194_08665 [Candidatus Eremiobacteraeota bacterium]|nr:hypothetical protein [Candidatus Eremiobacteraeota bacterium]
MKPHALVFAAVALAAAALAASAGAGSSSPLQNVFPMGRVFAVAEEQVYVIQRHQTLVVRYRSPSGDIVSRTLTRQDSHSIAFTVEGYENGAAVVAVADDVASDQAARPSPAIGNDGSIAQAGALSALTPIALVLSGSPPPENTGGQSPAPLTEGGKWPASGAVQMPFGTTMLRLTNASNAWEGNDAVQQVVATGSIDSNASVTVPGLGIAALHGGGTANGTSFVDMEQRLVLGSSYTMTGSGNLSTRNGQNGTYMMKGDYLIALARFIPGRPGPGYAEATELPRNIETVPPDSDIMHGGASSEISHPAPTDNIMREPPPQTEAGPPPQELSLPPVPLPSFSGARLASPPAPPPTPMPTRTPR